MSLTLSRRLGLGFTQCHSGRQPPDSDPESDGAQREPEAAFGVWTRQGAFKFAHNARFLIPGPGHWHIMIPGQARLARAAGRAQRVPLVFTT